MSVRVVTAREAAELDATAIARGVSSRELMRAAGEGAAQLLVERFPLEAERGVAVFTGGGNNGGDGWVLAAALARRGVRVRVAEIVPSGTPDARAARESASTQLAHQEPDGTEGVLVDALLGTGARDAPRDAVAAAIERIEARRGMPETYGSVVQVVSLDVPSGLDATSGATPGVSVRADLTVAFGSVKRGLLLNRAACGAIAVVDIGLAPDSASPVPPVLVDAAYARDVVPRIAADAHKGTRRRLVIVGGARGMAGAVILASRAARRSGIGMVRLCVAPESLVAVQAAEPAATAVAWPVSEPEYQALFEWAHVLLVGPGLGTDPHAHAMVKRFVAGTTCPVVLDADALPLQLGRRGTSQLADLLAERAAVLTPHVAECARLMERSVDDVRRACFDVAAELSRMAGGVVLLKGTPTVASDGARCVVSASGTPVLATAGSGDVLAGIVATLLGQLPASRANALAAAATGAWVHGRAAELAGAGTVRGVTLDDVVDALRSAWRLAPATSGLVLAELPSLDARGGR